MPPRALVHFGHGPNRPESDKTEIPCEADSQHIAFLQKSRCTFRGLCEPSADGPGTQTELLSDLSGGHALLLELYHLLIPLKAAFVASALHLLDEGRSKGLSRSNWNGSS